MFMKLMFKRREYYSNANALRCSAEGLTERERVRIMMLPSVLRSNPESGSRLAGDNLYDMLVEERRL